MTFILRTIVFAFSLFLGAFCLAAGYAAFLAYQTDDSIVPITIMAFSVWLALIFIIPKARRRFTQFTANYFLRILFSLPILLYVATSTQYLPLLFAQNGPLFGLVNTQHYQMALMAVLAIYGVTFVLPGLSHIALLWQLKAQWAEHQRAQGIEPDTTQTGSGGVFSNVLSWIVALIFFGAVFGGNIFPTLPNPTHVDWVEENVLLIMGGAFLVGIVSCLFQSNALQPSNLATGAVLGGLMSMFAMTASKYGAPALMSLVSDGTPKTVQVTVIERGRKHARRSCDFTATVDWNGRQGKLCSIPPQIWESLRRGQKLRLQGDENPLGLRYHVIDKTL